MILTIDPGNAIGYALWRKDLWRRGILTHPVSYGKIENRKDKEKTFHQFKELVINNMPITLAFMENSALMRGSATGRVSADSGALVKLSQTIGRLYQILIDNHVKVELISVAKWKGSLPKDVCERRIRRLLPRLRDKESNHAIDAIGIGLYMLGKF